MSTESPDIPVGAPVWMDLITSDPVRSAAFYSELFGWDVRDTGPEMRGYQYFELNGAAVGGCMQNDPDWQSPDGWAIFLRTDDARATAAAAAANSGHIIMEFMAVEPNGAFTMLADPGGAMISGWQPGTESGFGVLGEENTPQHFELHTREYDKVVQFYADVFGWTPHVLADEHRFRYTTFGEQPNPRAGILDASILPEDAPMGWSVYIGVSDIDKTVERAVELGAQVIQQIEDTPYGRLATLSDVTGARVKLRG